MAGRKWRHQSRVTLALAPTGTLQIRSESAIRAFRAKNMTEIEELRQRTPEIVVQEMRWIEGRKLISFQIIGEGRTEDANWFCDVELPVSSGDGKEPLKKTVAYVVGTDPVITVFRVIL